MKKVNLLIMFLVSFIVLFVNVDVINAKLLATCTYKPSKSKINGILEGVNLVVNVYDDKTVKSKIKLGSWSDTPESGGIISDTGVYQQFSRDTFKKNGVFYKKFKEENTCPQMQFIFYSTGQLHFNVGGGRVTEGFPNDTVSATITNKDDSVSKEEVVCQKTLNLNTGENITVKFIKSGSKKKFIVDEGGRGTHSSGETGVAVGNVASYIVREEDKSVFWDKSKCDKANLYDAQSVAGANISLTLQSTKPDDALNATSNNGCENAGKGGCLPEGSKGGAVTDVCSILSSDIVDFIKKIVGYLQIGTVFLALVLGILDFVGAIGSDKDNAFKDAGKKFLKRLIAVALVFLVPAIIGIILNFVSVANDCNIDIFG